MSRNEPLDASCCIFYSYVSGFWEAIEPATFTGAAGFFSSKEIPAKGSATGLRSAGRIEDDSASLGESPGRRRRAGAALLLAFTSLSLLDAGWATGFRV